MKTTFKVLLSILGLLSLIVLLAVGALVYFVDPNQLKPAIIEEVKDKTGYQLVIDGVLSWSFYPQVGVKIDHMTLSDPTRHQGPFMEASDVRLATDLQTLLNAKGKLQGKVYIANLRLMTLHAQDVSADLHWEDAVLTLQPIKASLYQGSLYGSVTGRYFSSLPDWEWSMQCDHFQVNTLLQDLSQKDNQGKLSLTGIGSIKLHAETHGKNNEQLLSALNGDGNFNVMNGSVQGVDLNYFFQTADAILNQTTTTGLENTHHTNFDRLTGSFQIKNGVASTNDILLLSPVFLTAGVGSVDLLSRMVDFQLGIKSQQAAQTQWEIPVLLSGSVDHPEIRLDTLKIQRYLASKEIKKVKEKAIEQIKKHVPGKTGEFLQQLLQ